MLYCLTLALCPVSVSALEIPRSEEGDPSTGSARKGQGPCGAGDVMERAETRTVYEWRAVVDLTA